MNVVNSIKESYNELVHKVSWPTSTEVFNSAVVVLIASIIMSLIVFAMDFSIEKVMTLIYSIRF